MVKKKDKASKGSGAASAAKDPLHDAIETFARGDYGKAKVALSAAATDPALSEGQKEQARELIDAMKLERGTLWVGIACVGLLALVIAVTAMTQP